MKLNLFRSKASSRRLAEAPTQKISEFNSKNWSF